MGSGGKLERGGSWVTEREASPAKQSRAQQKEWTPSPDSDLSTASDRQCVCMCVCVCVCVRTCAYGQANGIWKFPGQGLDPHHCSDPGHCSDNARSLTCCATKGLPGSFWFCYFFSFYSCTCGTWRVPGQGSDQSCSCRPISQPWQHRIQAMSCVCNPHCSLRQHRILNPPSEVRDRTHILMDTMSGSKATEP